MNISSLKKDLIRDFSIIPSIEGLEKNKLILITSFGIISGVVPVKEDDALTANTLLQKMSESSLIDYYNRYSIPDNESIEGSDGFISLIDVTVKTSSATYVFPFLNVFFDQVIGVTVGDV